jgi:hypothetical protein
MTSASSVQSRPGQRIVQDEREMVTRFDVDLPQVIALRRQLYSESDIGWSGRRRVVGDRYRLARPASPRRARRVRPG